MRTLLQAEIDSIIWEADTDCDRCLTWKEFQEMYDRCRNDQTGIAPLSTELVRIVCDERLPCTLVYGSA